MSATWTQPTATCSSRRNQYAAFWAGLDGFNSNSAQQTGTDSDCAGRTPHYYGWYDMFPAFPVNYQSGLARSSAEVITEAPSSNRGVLPLADFGTINYSSALANGSSLGSLSPTEIIMVDNSGLQKDSTSPISGGSFSNTWSRSS